MKGRVSLRRYQRMHLLTRHIFIFGWKYLETMIPEMDGYALAERIRELSRKDSGTVRIVALTASSVTVTEEKVLACGINEILDKPFDVKKFNQLIRG